MCFLVLSLKPLQDVSYNTVVLPPLQLIILNSPNTCEHCHVCDEEDAVVGNTKTRVELVTRIVTRVMSTKRSCVPGFKGTEISKRNFRHAVSIKNRMSSVHLCGRYENYPNHPVQRYLTNWSNNNKTNCIASWNIHPAVSADDKGAPWKSVTENSSQSVRNNERWDTEDLITRRRRRRRRGLDK